MIFRSSAVTSGGGGGIGGCDVKICCLKNVFLHMSTAQIMGTESVTPKPNIKICTNHVKCH